MMNFLLRAWTTAIITGLFFSPLNAQEAEGLSGPRTLYTMGEVQELLQTIGLSALLELNVDTSADLADDSYLLILADYIDLNIIGAGKSVTLDPAPMIKLIADNLTQGRKASEIGRVLIGAIKRPGRTPEDTSQTRRRTEIETRFGGFFVGEFEHHQEPDGKLLQLLEVNQARLYFSAKLNGGESKNRVSFLAEWNPVPEEVIHHIDQITIATGKIADTLRVIDNEVEGLIPFEQLFVKIDNVGNSGVSLTWGQFRLPFGIWSDYTSHRNFSSTKSNTLVNGFALKKIELGMAVEKTFANGIGFQAAIVNGRQVRTSNLDRADNDNKKDFAGRLSYAWGRSSFGLSSYLAEFKFKRNTAYGLDLTLPWRRWIVSGELIYQKNFDANSTFGTRFNFNAVAAKSGYIQFDYALTNRLHLYGFYESWNYYKAGNQKVNQAAHKIFHGARYSFNPYLRWTLVEFGRMFHHDFDQGKIHLGTQLEFTF